MAITVEEALQLDILKGFKVIAGKNGLSNKINHVAVWDYETNDLIKENFSPEDFALSTLVSIRDDINKLYSAVKTMIGVGISCLAIKNIYFDYIPGNVIELANRNDFPLMTFENTYTEDIIVSVNKAIDEKKKYEDLASKIDCILYNNLNDMSIREIALNINRNFKEKNMIAFCKKKNNEIKLIKSFLDKMEEMERINCKVISYESGYIIINTFEKASKEDISKVILRRLEWFGFTDKQYFIGLSSLHQKLGELNNAIKESLYAYRYSVAYEKNVSFFEQIGINKMILPLINNQWVLDYCKKMIEPIAEYDRVHETEFLETAIKYVENDGDINTTAEELFQHSNTIRYRIFKIKKILMETCSVQHFYEELAAAVRIYNLLNKSL